MNAVAVSHREGRVIHVVAGHVEDATAKLKRISQPQVSTDENALPFKSRDFH